jgi:hypothetical protein
LESELHPARPIALPVDHPINGTLAPLPEAGLEAEHETELATPQQNGRRP